MGPDPKGVTGDVQLVMMGSGDERYSNFLRRYLHVPWPVCLYLCVCMRTNQFVVLQITHAKTFWYETQMRCNCCTVTVCALCIPTYICTYLYTPFCMQHSSIHTIHMHEYVDVSSIRPAQCKCTYETGYAPTPKTGVHVCNSPVRVQS